MTTSFQSSLEAFVEAWRQHRRSLYAMCLRWSRGDPDAAAETLACASLRALERLSEERVGVVNYGAWLMRIAQNLCVDSHRKCSSRRRALERYVLAMDDAAAAEPPEGGLLRCELMARILEEMDALPPLLREPCRMRLLDELPYEDIADRLRLSNETIRKRVQFGRDILRENLRAYLEEPAREARCARRERSQTRAAPVFPTECVTPASAAPSGRRPRAGRRRKGGEHA